MAKSQQTEVVETPVDEAVRLLGAGRFINPEQAWKSFGWQSIARPRIVPFNEVTLRVNGSTRTLVPSCGKTIGEIIGAFAKGKIFVEYQGIIQAKAFFELQPTTPMGWYVVPKATYPIARMTTLRTGQFEHRPVTIADGIQLLGLLISSGVNIQEEYETDSFVFETMQVGKHSGPDEFFVKVHGKNLKVLSKAPEHSAALLMTRQIRVQ